MEKWFVTVKSYNYLSFKMFTLCVTGAFGLVTVVYKQFSGGFRSTCRLLREPPPIGLLAGMPVPVLLPRASELPSEVDGFEGRIRATSA